MVLVITKRKSLEQETGDETQWKSLRSIDKPL